MHHVTIDLEGNTLADLRAAVAALQDLPSNATFVVTVAQRSGGTLRGDVPVGSPTRFGTPLTSITATTPRESA